jgi:hypothetical protein
MTPLWFGDFLQQLGYQNDPKFKFYWLLPRKTFAHGLRIIASNHETNVMAYVVYVNSCKSSGKFAKGFESS